MNTIKEIFFALVVAITTAILSVCLLAFLVSLFWKLFLTFNKLLEL